MCIMRKNSKFSKKTKPSTVDSVFASVHIGLAPVEVDLREDITACERTVA